MAWWSSRSPDVEQAVQSVVLGQSTWGCGRNGRTAHLVVRSHLPDGTLGGYSRCGATIISLLSHSPAGDQRCQACLLEAMKSASPAENWFDSKS